MPPVLTETIVSKEQAGTRLDHFLHELYPEISVNGWRRALAGGRVRVDGRVAAKGLILGAGQKVVFPVGLLEELSPAGPAAEAGPLAVLYRDADLLAVDKPAGCYTHPLRPGETGTLVNRLLHHFPGMVEVEGFGLLQPGLLNRLDFATSGIVLAACNNAAWQRFRAAFAVGQVGKEYLGLVGGRLDRKLSISAELTHDPHDSRKMAVAAETSAGRGSYPARTEVEPLRFLADYDLTLVRLEMRTGVMHQLRVHLAQAGYPLAGDRLYGGRPLPEIPGFNPPVPDFFCLHCSRMVLPGGLEITAPAPVWAESGG